MDPDVPDHAWIPVMIDHDTYPKFDEVGLCRSFPPNGPVVFTGGPAVTHFLENSFLLLHITTAIFACVVASASDSLQLCKVGY
jgi:hypothetical protein